MSRFISRYLLALMVFNLVACSSMQPVNVERAMNSSPPTGVDYGSLIEVKMLDGKTSKFRVTEITELGLGGNSGFYKYENMKSLKAEAPSSSSNDTAAWVFGILGVIALVALVANADAYKICSPPCNEP